MDKTIFHWRNTSCHNISFICRLSGCILFPATAAAVPPPPGEIQSPQFWLLLLGTLLLLISCVALALWLRLRRELTKTEQRAAGLARDYRELQRRLLYCNKELSQYKRQLTRARENFALLSREKFTQSTDLRLLLHQPLDALRRTLDRLAKGRGTGSPGLIEAARSQLRVAHKLLQNSGLEKRPDGSLPKPPLRYGPRLSILLVESDHNQSLRDFLLRLGHRVQRENNGPNGANAALTKHFDLILIDSHLPLMDGVETARRIRSRGCRAPVFALLSDHRPGDRERYRAQGLTGVLTRPVSPSLLQQLLNRISRRADNSSRADSPRLLNTETLHRRRDAVGQRTFARLLQQRTALLPKQAAALAGALTGRHWPDAVKLAETLADGAEEVGLEALAARTRELAAQLESETQRENCRQQRSEILSLVRRSTERLKSWKTRICAPGGR